MEAPMLERDADVRSLPHGTRVGPWRLKGGRGLGVYGAVYRAVREGHEAAGEVALKLAIYPRDARFQREAELLRRVRHPSVPRLLDSGAWRHPSGFSYPYVVMEGIEGEPLYEWASRRNPSQHQVFELLAQAARALQATHEAGGVHRDVKGGNIMVRPLDDRLFLMDFGAGDYAGAERLTSSLLPPGTPAYRSPEAWEYGRSLRRRSHDRYVAGPADDVFALGVMAYRLATDEYPPFTDASMEEGKCWQPGGSGPRPPAEVNPRVGPELDAVIRRMLSLQPEERGTAEELAEQMERGAEQTRREAQEGLFEWETLTRAEWPREDLADAEELGHRARRRSREGVRAAVEADAAKRAEANRQQAKALTRTGGRDEPRARRMSWLLWLAATGVGVLLLWPRDRQTVSTEEELRVAEKSSAEGQQDGGVIYVGDTATASASSWVQPAGGKGIALEVPPKPLPGQLKPDGNGHCRKGLVALNGGCWLKVEVGDLENCQVVKNGVVFKASCYAPIFPSTREPTSAPVEPESPDR
jgi:eukaryotic-like serine/threonine-protein kinase